MGFFVDNATFLPDRTYVRELRRPWKLSSFMLGMAWLIHGALNYDIADWDIGVSLVMGFLTYLLAPWSVNSVGTAFKKPNRRKICQALLGIAFGILVADGSYTLYHKVVGNSMDRRANFLASLTLYFMAGTIWLFRGSLSEFWQGLRRLTSRA